MEKRTKKRSFSYRNASYEEISCNICRGSKVESLATKDRYNLPVSTVMCKDCGLVFISPRMKKDWYDLYYQEEYRRQGAWYKGLFKQQEIGLYYNPAALFKKAVVHGEKILKEIEPYLRKGFTLEVGSSSGGILSAFKNIFGGEVLGIEPSKEESDYANFRGVTTRNMMFENFAEAGIKADTILCVRSLNHLLDPRLFLEWSYGRMNSDGHLVLEVMNFYSVAKRFCYIPVAIQIDHVYMFTPNTLRNLVVAAGFEVVYMNTDADPTKEHMLLVARKNSNNENVKFLYNEVYVKEKESFDMLQNSVTAYWMRFGRRRLMKRVRSWLRARYIDAKDRFR